MSWRQTAGLWATDLLKVSIAMVLLLDGLAVVVFSLWFVAKGLYHLSDWLNSWLFS